MPPSQSLNQLANAVLLARQSVQTIGAGSGQPANCGGQYSGGTLAGAILGTFFGTLLFGYLFSYLFNNQSNTRSETVIVEKKKGSRRHRSHSESSSVRRPSRAYTAQG